MGVRAANHAVYMHCPDCGGRTLCRSSWSLTDGCREAKYICQDPDCAASFVAQVAVVRFVRRGIRPNPQVSAPVTGTARSPSTVDPHQAQHPRATATGPPAGLPPRAA